MIQMNLFSKQKQPHRHREQTSGCQWGKVGGVMDWEVRLSRCKVLHTEGMDNKVLLIQHRELYSRPIDKPYWKRI